jgi:hypothetical protein
MGPDLAIARGKIPADRVVGALAEASRSLGALAAWGQGAASIAVAAGDLPFVLQTPLVALEEVDPTHDPAWIHVPGAWSGGLATLQERALARGEDAAVLVQGLQTWRASEAPLGKGSPPR